MFDEAKYLASYPDVAKAVREGVFKTGYEHFQKYGEKEGRSPNGATSLREKAVFHLLDKQGLGLEIGPSHNPIAPKAKGYKVHVLDHASAGELRAKYQGHEEYGVNLDNIEEVDFIWRGQPLTELIGNTECYDWIIASHVVEHIPDLVSFLQQCEQLLKPQGVLSLVIPDKRYCFDYFQPISTTGMLLDAYKEKRTRPSSGQVFDHFANAASCNGVIAWSAESVGGGGEYSLLHTVPGAVAQWKRAVESSEYIDVHCWRFTPESFQLILSDLKKMDLIRLEIKAEFPTSGSEFYVSMSKSASAISTLSGERLENLATILNENKP